MRWEIKLWIETSKLQVETSKNFQIYLKTFILKFCLFFKPAGGNSSFIFTCNANNIIFSLSG